MNEADVIVKKNPRLKDPILNPLQKMELANRIIEWILEGKPYFEIRDLAIDFSPVPLKKETAQTYIDYARGLLEEIVEQDVQVIGTIHLGMYEKIYAYFREIGNVEGMNKALKAKERLLGLHKKDEKVVFNKKTNINVTKEVVYDISKLNAVQKNRFEYLLNKATGK